MNINYHYFVIKTLASYAGYTEDDAQWIAHFSQQIDDYILSSPLFLDEEPPEFFIENGMAYKLPLDLWLFFPHATGIDFISSVFEKFQRETITPFHFIPTKTLSEIESIHPVKRSDYCCVEATSSEAILVNRLMQDVTERASASHDKKTLMEFGMMLHTYADTFSHCHFSGLHGSENNSYVKEAFDTYKNAEGLNELEILFFKASPSIGHANVGHTPDICDYRINLIMKKADPIQRDNMTFFALCSRNLLEFLCKSNNRSPIDTNEWEALQIKLSAAEKVPNEEDIPALEKHWKQVFPDYNYHYQKEEAFNLNLTAGEVSDDMLSKSGASKDDVLDLYSEKGNQARAGIMLLASEADQVFFDYNELAYRRVMEVTGSYGMSITNDELKLYQNAVERFAPSMAKA
jgi:hypothetical protein